MDRMICPMCGLEFDITPNIRCSGCVLKSKCETVCCPRCGYATVVESSLVSWAKRLFGKRAAAR
jgi:hypothetical protein